MSNIETRSGLTRRELTLGAAGIGMFTECSASDGWQSRIRNGIEVTWKYYPDAGLRVFFEYVG